MRYANPGTWLHDNFTGRPFMTDLERLGLALVGFAVVVVVAGVLLGLVGAWIRGRRHDGRSA